MKIIFSTGTLLMLGSLCVNAVAAEPLVVDQQLNKLNSTTDQHNLKDGKQLDQSGHKMPVNVKDVGNRVEPSVDDDCE